MMPPPAPPNGMSGQSKGRAMLFQTGSEENNSPNPTRFAQPVAPFVLGTGKTTSLPETSLFSSRARIFTFGTPAASSDAVKSDEREHGPCVASRQDTSVEASPFVFGASCSAGAEQCFRGDEVRAAATKIPCGGLSAPPKCEANARTFVFGAAKEPVEDENRVDWNQGKFVFGSGVGESGSAVPLSQGPAPSMGKTSDARSSVSTEGTFVFGSSEDSDADRPLPRQGTSVFRSKSSVAHNTTLNEPPFVFGSGVSGVRSEMPPRPGACIFSACAEAGGNAESTESAFMSASACSTRSSEGKIPSRKGCSVSGIDIGGSGDAVTGEGTFVFGSCEKSGASESSESPNPPSFGRAHVEAAAATGGRNVVFESGSANSRGAFREPPRTGVSVPKAQTAWMGSSVGASQANSLFRSGEISDSQATPQPREAQVFGSDTAEGNSNPPKAQDAFAFCTNSCTSALPPQQGVSESVSEAKSVNGGAATSENVFVFGSSRCDGSNPMPTEAAPSFHGLGSAEAGSRVRTCEGAFLHASGSCPKTSQEKGFRNSKNQCSFVFGQFEKWSFDSTAKNLEANETTPPASPPRSRRGRSSRTSTKTRVSFSRLNGSPKKTSPPFSSCTPSEEGGDERSTFVEVMNRVRASCISDPARESLGGRGEGPSLPSELPNTAEIRRTVRAVRPLPKAQREEQAELSRKRGSEQYRAGEYKAAVLSYSGAISLQPASSKHFANRAAAYVMLKHYELAARDCSRATALDASNIRAWLRGARALVRLGRGSDANLWLTKCNEILARSGSVDEGNEKRTKLCKDAFERNCEQWREEIEEIRSCALRLKTSLDEAYRALSVGRCDSALLMTTRAVAVAEGAPRLRILYAAALLLGASDVESTVGNGTGSALDQERVLRAESAVRNAVEQVASDLSSAAEVGGLGGHTKELYSDLRRRVGPELCVPAVDHAKTLHRQGFVEPAEKLLELLLAAIERTSVGDASSRDAEPRSLRGLLGPDVDNATSAVSQLLSCYHRMSKARREANHSFPDAAGVGKYTEAIRRYSAAMKLDRGHDWFNALLLCNRAAARMALRDYVSAVDDCEQALRRRPLYTKARLRKARALMQRVETLQ